MTGDEARLRAIRAIFEQRGCLVGSDIRWLLTQVDRLTVERDAAEAAAEPPGYSGGVSELGYEGDG